MLDFLMVSTRPTKRGVIEIYPKLIIKNPSEHLMIRGGDFYAVWVEEKGLWSTSEQDALNMIDDELDIYAKENAERFDGGYRVLHMWDAESGMIDTWHKYCQRQMRDSFHMLDEKLIFSNTVTTRKDYASKRLPYPLEPGDTSAWERLTSVLYSPEERAKIEWAIGAIVSGDSRSLQKFMVFYGSAGTGKSTILNIIQKLFDGYTSVFDAKALGSSSNAFALEAFKSNPLVAIQHDGDLSKIEDNTRINSLVSHEVMTVNEKFKSAYANRFKCFLFMGTNKPVRITDAKSGLIRRLIDVTPTGDKIRPSEYHKLMTQVNFELGAIAQRCLDIYKSNMNAYDDYIPINMLGASNDFYNFVLDSWAVFSRDDCTTLKGAWTMYKNYCDEAKVSYPYSQRAFKEELKNYFREYNERETLVDGVRVRNRYSGFRKDKFESTSKQSADHSIDNSFELPLNLRYQPSMFDDICASCPAQYANENGTPYKRWSEVTTVLSDLDTTRLHYVRIPSNHIVVDFDIPGPNGEKSFEHNVEAAMAWPPTYAEVSKSGKGIHLHYIYTGDVSELSSFYAEHIEVKIFTGNSSLRRKRTLCNNLPIATLTHGLPKKDVKKTINFDSVKSETSLRNLIKRNLAKEIHPSTKSSIDFINKILTDAYDSNLKFDVSDMKNSVLAFAARSTHNAGYCVKLVSKMPFKSKEDSATKDTTGSTTSSDERAIVFYDTEVFPNLFLVNWKLAGKDKPVIRMINPKPAQIEELLQYRLIDFNGRRYDRHLLYACLIGYSNEQLYNLSQRIISSGKKSSREDCFFSEAYNIGYTDVYDFASAGNKKSLKKLEIEMGIHHQELGLPWDQPVPEELWIKVAEYCDNDVIATEAAFNYLSADWTARQILADMAGMSVNDTTNSLTERIIFGKERKPQHEFKYRNLAEPVKELDDDMREFLLEALPEMVDYWYDKYAEGEET